MQKESFQCARLDSAQAAVETVATRAKWPDQKIPPPCSRAFCREAGTFFSVSHAGQCVWVRRVPPGRDDESDASAANDAAATNDAANDDAAAVAPAQQVLSTDIRVSHLAWTKDGERQRSRSWF